MNKKVKRHLCETCHESCRTYVLASCVFVFEIACVISDLSPSCVSRQPSDIFSVLSVHVFNGAVFLYARQAFTMPSSHRTPFRKCPCHASTQEALKFLRKFSVVINASTVFVFLIGYSLDDCTIKVTGYEYGLIYFNLLS